MRVVGLTLVCLAVACGDDPPADPPDSATTTGGTDAGGADAGGADAGGAGAQGGGGGTATGPGCEGLPLGCGPAQNDDCCASTMVEGGTFLRSYDGITHTDDTHPATVSSFTLDVYEVTVARFRAFVAAGMGTQASPPAADAGAHPLIPTSGWFSGWDGYLPVDTAALTAALACKPDAQTWSDAPDPARETLPINCVTWFEAFAFCIWDGGRLPTEAEWNYAAAGGAEQRAYPWGAGIDPAHAAYDCLADGLPDCAFSDIIAVGARSPAGDGKWGHADLGGNVWELAFDWFDAYVDPCVDCAHTQVTAYHTARGGSWGSVSEGVLASERKFVTAASRSSEIGFRCAR